MAHRTLRLTFRLAQRAEGRLVSDRAMHFGVRQLVAAVSAAALIFICSCEKHHLGEDPEVQKEHAIGPGESHENSGATKETSAAPAATASPTPAEFFPDSTPR